MKKLEDIPKKEIFNVPEGYFDKLPTQIQSRVAGREKRDFTFVGNLKYALPIVTLLVVGIFWFYPMRQQQQDSTAMLATVNTEDLVAYLNESDLSTDEVLESVDFNAIDLDDIEENVYDLNADEKESLENLINEVD
jgi:hypothetical protein